MKDWEKYEVQIFNKFMKDFPKSLITKNIRIRGLKSKVPRQIDILIERKVVGFLNRVVVDCKYFKKCVTIKTVEAFLGQLEDVGATNGIMITEVGYTRGAKNRVTAMPHVRLDIVKFEDFESYYFGWDYCPDCNRPHHILWSGKINVKFKRKVISCQQGQCEYCGSDLFKCEECGTVLDFISEKSTCSCGYKYQMEMVNIGSGMTEPELSIVGKWT